MASESEQEGFNVPLSVVQHGPGDSGWESIFSSIKAEVPSLDSDEASLSDYEDEDVHIFQRVDTKFVADQYGDLFNEELDFVSQDMEEQMNSEREGWLGSERNLASCTNNNIHLAAIKHGSDVVSSSTSPDVMSPCPIQPGSPYPIQAVPPHTRTEGPEQTENGQLHRLSPGDGGNHCDEDRETEKKSGSDVHGNVEQGSFPAEPIGFSLHSLEHLEQWDLDAILQQIKVDGDGQRQHIEATDPAKNPEKMPIVLLPLEHSSVKRQEQIMKQLVEFSAKQSKAISHLQQLAKETQERKSSEISCRADLLHQKLGKSGGWRHPEKMPTVYIDLRTTASSVGTVTGGEKHPDLSAQAEQKEEEVALNMPDQTSKSLLLNQLRQSKNVLTSVDNSPPQSESVLEERENTETVPFPQIRRMRRVKTGVDVSKCTPKIQEEEENEQKGVTEEKSNEKENVTQILLSSPKKRQKDHSEEELARREKQEKEKRSRQRMQIQLEGLKPRSSVGGHQPMADATPVLFHPEASYCTNISTLPASESRGVEMLLLTVWLSSCGQVITPGQHGGRFPDSALFLANTYHALVTWLLSLVPALNPHSVSDAPFHVLGLQQAWREEGLALYACLSPRSRPAQNSPKIRKHKGKEDLRGTSSFYQQVFQFLSQNTLQSVACWSEEVRSHLQGRLFPLLLEVPAMRLTSIATLNPAPEAVGKVFSSSCGFYWQTVETEEKLNPLVPERSTESETEVVSVILFDTLLKDSAAFHHVLHLIFTAGLDVCGLRLLYPQAATLHSYIDTLPKHYASADVQTPPVLALALRGTRAEEVWGDITGPCDPQLARLTDQDSLHALYGIRREEPILHSARRSGRLLLDLSLWFGGQIPSRGNLNIGIQNPPGRSTQPRSQSLSEKDLTGLQGADLCRPPALLTATTKGDVFLVVSPAVPPLAFGDVIDTCYRRGFSLHGLRRLRLSAKRATLLSMSPTQVTVFCPSKLISQTDALPCYHLPEQCLHCLLFLFRKENAGHHTPGLIQALMNELAEQGLLGVIRNSLPHLSDLDPTLCFHVAPYSDSLLQSLGGSLHALPGPGTTTRDMFKQPFASDPEDEHVVVLTMSGSCTLRRAGYFLRQILRPPLKTQNSNSGSRHQGFEVLGLKWLPVLSRLQAKEITPYEVGDRSWRESVDQLMSNPALVCALRRSHAFTVLANTIRELVPTSSRGPQQLIVSPTPETAFRQAAVIFSERDLVSDPASHPGLIYKAPLGISCETGGTGGCRGQIESIFTYMLSGPPLLYTALLLKPHSWSRNLGKILHKADLQRFSVVGMKLISLTPEDSIHILPAAVRQDKALRKTHCDYLTSAPCLVLCLRRRNAVLKLLDLLGPEEPKHCKAQDQTLWRAQYGTSAVQNGMYGSPSYQAAIRDIKHFFPEGLVCDQSPVLEAEQIPRLTCDVLLGSHTQRQIVKNHLREMGQSSIPDLPFTSALCQTTCLLFPPSTLRGSPMPCFQGLEQLIGREFRITGARLTMFNQSQAQLAAKLYSPVDSLSDKFKALTEGPCLLIAAQRDNAVTCFNSLMESVQWQSRPMQNFTQEVLYPPNESQAEKILSAVFESLTPDSIHQIVLQAS
ncbi:dynein axonemal assembly factor 8-like [Rhinophrynus dorsalis]